MNDVPLDWLVGQLFRTIPQGWSPLGRHRPTTGSSWTAAICTCTQKTQQMVARCSRSRWPQARQRRGGHRRQ